MHKRLGLWTMLLSLAFACPVFASQQVETFSAQYVTVDGEEAPVVVPADEPTVGPTAEPSEEPEVLPVLDGVKLQTPSMVTYNSIKLTWNVLPDAKGYEIYRSTSKLAGYKKIKDIKAGDTQTYTDKKSLVTGKKYYYKILAYGYNKAGKKLTGAYSKPVKITCTLPAVKLSSAKVSGICVKLKWKKVSGADGYVLYKADAEDSKAKYKQFMLIEGGKVTSCEVPAGDANGSFNYMIKAYRLKGKKKVQAEVGSNTKSATLYVFANAKESFAQKCQRAFGQNSYVRYINAAQAEAHMKTITIKVWDVGALGIKVSRTKTFKVNANLAPTVEQIFKEIYEGKEKFPIKSIGGYSWRGNGSTSEHNQGTAIDINWEENYMIEGNGTISSGKLWAPGSNAYSIPANGEVVKIFAKYGFRWGGLGWPSGRKDYMHFSYFGT